MRILHVTTRNLPGGSARNLGFHLAWERAAGCEVHLVVGGTEEVGSPPDGVHLHRMPDLVRAPNPRADLLAAAQLRRLIAAVRPDVVHTHQSKAGILARLAARGRAPVVVHTVHMASFGPGYSRLASAAFTTAERHCGRFTDFFVAVGDELKNRYLGARIGREEQYTVIRSAVQVERFLATRCLTGPERAALRRRLSLPPHESVLLAAGLLERRKRFDLAIRQLAGLLVRAPAVLLIAGVGSEEAALRAAAAAHGAGQRVRLLGFVENLHEYAAVADLLVHTSLTEGLPQVVVQALAAGLPVLATEAVGLSELAPAPLHVVPSDGGRLAAAAERLLGAGRPGAMCQSRLQPWTEAAVGAATSCFHARLEESLAMRRPAL